MAAAAATAGAKATRKANGQAGKPHTLDRPVPVYATILPSGEALAELVRTGLPIKEAAQALGLDWSGAYRCLGDGRVVAGLLWEGRLEDDQLTDYQQAALRYFHLVDAAEAEAIALHTRALASHAQGGNVRTRETVTLDKDGNEVGKTVTTETLPPDVRATTFWLERRVPGLFGRTERREHALVGGDATVGVASPREKLAEALAQITRRKAAGAGVVAAMGVIDVDEIDDDETGAATA